MSLKSHELRMNLVQFIPIGTSWVLLSSWNNPIPILPNNMPHDSGITKNANEFSSNLVKLDKIGYKGSH